MCLGFNVHDTGMNRPMNAQFVLAKTVMASNRIWISRLRSRASLKTGDDSTTRLFIKSFNCCEKQIFIFRHIFMVLWNDHFMKFIKFLYVLNSTCLHHSLNALRSDVGEQRCPDSVRNYCAVSVGQNQVQIRNPDTRKPSRLKILDFDWQTRHSKSGQNLDSAVRRRLISTVFIDEKYFKQKKWNRKLRKVKMLKRILKKTI